MDRSLFSRARGLPAILASALLLGAYALGGPAWPLGLLALVPWLRALDAAATLRQALLSAWLMSVAFAAAVFGWFGTAMGNYTGLGGAAGVALLLALAPLLQPQLFAFVLARRLGARRGPLAAALAGAAAWVACEALWPKLLGDTLAHGLLPSAWLRQAADLGGTAGLTVLLLLVNEALAAALRSPRGARGAIRPLGLAGVLLAAWTGYGTLRLAALPATPPEAPVLRVAMVQASLADYAGLRERLGTYGAVREVLDTHYALSWSARRDHGADVLLWTETMYPTTFGHPRSEGGAELDAEIRGFVDAVGAMLVFGTYDLDARGEYNAAVFLEPGRGPLGTYRKTHPFPLTEHVPAWLDGPRLRAWLPWAGSWIPGDGARVLPLRAPDGREVNVVPLICLDDVRPGLAIDGARLGAQAIVGLSNDAWFSGSERGARLHLAVAAFRSIETRLPQVRVTTNGLSAIIDPSGEVLAQTGLGDQAVLTAHLAAVDPPPSLVVRWGDWVGRAAALALAAWAAWAGLRALARRRRPGGEQRVVLLTPGWRLAAAALQAVMAATLAWLLADMLLRTGLQVQALHQLQAFAAGVLLPGLAWIVLRAWFGARWWIAGEALHLQTRRELTDVPLASITTLTPWRLPLPDEGVVLGLASGRRLPVALAGADPVALLAALAAAGAPARLDGAYAARAARRAQLRTGTRARWLDRPWLKFGLFPLLPAAVAFRLHQVIAFGGPFGEVALHGWSAWWQGLGLWWLSWMLGMAGVAAVLRVLLETVGGLARLAWPAQAAGVHAAAAALARIAYYLGVPAWLAWRLLPG